MQRVLGVLLPSGAEGDPTGDDAHQQQVRDGGQHSTPPMEDRMTTSN